MRTGGAEPGTGPVEPRGEDILVPPIQELFAACSR